VRDLPALAAGVSVGGFGCVLGSLANLIALRLAKVPHGLREFHRISLPFLLVCAASALLLRLEGTEEGPSPKGEAGHTVYRFERLASIDGEAPRHAQLDERIDGTVVRLNYARHGEPNGVVLDTGDFIHTKPDGFARLGLKVGDKVRAEGRAQPLATGEGRVVEAVRVNGQAVRETEEG
jgi:hypothetical protein